MFFEGCCLPSSRSCRRMLKTSGWAFSTCKKPKSLPEIVTRRRGPPRRRAPGSMVASSLPQSQSGSFCRCAYQISPCALVSGSPQPTPYPAVPSPFVFWLQQRLSESVACRGLTWPLGVVGPETNQSLSSLLHFHLRCASLKQIKLKHPCLFLVLTDSIVGNSHRWSGKTDILDFFLKR